MQWFKGKSLDGFCPMGPVVVTADEFGDPHAKRISLRLNGETRQDSTTANMIFPIDITIESLTKGMTLEPGDIIATGTPEGVGLGRTPPEYMKDGDVMETEIEGIGTMRNRIERVRTVGGRYAGTRLAERPGTCCTCLSHCHEESRMSDQLTADRLAIRETVENWVLWRDAGDWERFATVWHDDGWMTATWFQGPAQRFIEVSREGFNKGVNILHALGGWTCDVAGTRAISQVKMNILQRAPLDGVMVDVLCVGRFYDFFEKRDGRWGIVQTSADLREGPARPGRSVGNAGARSRTRSRGSPKGIATSGTCSRRTASPSSRGCRACGDRRSRRCTRRGRRGWRDRRSRACRSRSAARGPDGLQYGSRGSTQRPVACL